MLFYQDQSVTLYRGQTLEELREIPSCSVQMTVTSPPYWGLRSYGVEGQIGQEKTPEEYIATLAEIFREVRRVLRDDGTLWLNLGDSYANDSKWGGKTSGKHAQGLHGEGIGRNRNNTGLPAKNLCGIPWRVALALQADGWILRQDIIWAKPSPMPAPLKDRCVTAHEYLFLLTKSPRYYFDYVAIQEPISPKTLTVRTTPRKGTGVESTGEKLNKWMEENGGRYHPENKNKRSVWTVATTPYKKAHFAVFPPKLVEPCILAGTSDAGCCPVCRAPYRRLTEKTTIRRERPADKTARHEAGEGVNACGNTVAGVKLVTTGWQPPCKCGGNLAPVPCAVLDPFVGSGTTCMVANWHGRHSIGIDLSEAYLREHATERIMTPKPVAKRAKKRKFTDTVSVKAV